MRLQVRVRPGAKKNAVTGRGAGLLMIAIAAPPIEGRANEELVRFLAEELGIPRRQVQVIRGVTSRLKVLEIDAPPDVVQAWLDRIPL